MKYLVLLTPAPGRSREEFAAHHIEETKAVWAAYRGGLLREMYFQANPTVATLIYEAADEAAVNAEVDRLPMVEVGLLDRQVVQLGPWLPFEALFDKALMPG